MKTGKDYSHRALVMLLSFIAIAAAAEQDPVEPVVGATATAEPDEIEHVATANADPAVLQQRETLMPAREPHDGIDANLFARHSWYTAPKAEPARQVSRPVQIRPVAPPLPYTLLGTYEQVGSDTLFLLARDDRVFEVKLGDTLDGTYRIDRVANDQLMLIYLPLNTSQGLRLGE